MTDFTRPVESVAPYGQRKNSRMKVAVIGPGSVGGYYGGVLARHGEEVSLIARPGAHFDAIKANGLQLRTNWGDFTVNPQVTSDTTEVGPVDFDRYIVLGHHRVSEA